MNFFFHNYFFNLHQLFGRRFFFKKQLDLFEGSFMFYFKLFQKRLLLVFVPFLNFHCRNKSCCVLAQLIKYSGIIKCIRGAKFNQTASNLELFVHLARYIIIVSILSFKSIFLYPIRWGIQFYCAWWSLYFKESFWSLIVISSTN